MNRHRLGIACMAFLVSVACGQGLPPSQGTAGRGAGGDGIGGGGGAGDSSAAGTGGLPSASGGQGLFGGATNVGGTPSGGQAATGGSTRTGGAGPTGGTSSGGYPATGGASAGGTGGGTQGCAALGDYCTCMPKFVATQVVDGAGDEFADLPPMTFDLRSAPYVNPGYAAALSEKVTLRAGWSDLALHVHVHVTDTAIAPDGSSTLWNGDNVQLFSAGTGTLTGTYTGTEDGGAIHVLISAPDAGDVSRAVVIYQNGVASEAPFVTGRFAGRRVSDGYEIEAELDWSPYAEPPLSGSPIGFDLVVGAASSGGLALEGGLANKVVSGSSPACDLGGRVQPGCDDRTWCTPVLE